MKEGLNEDKLPPTMPLVISSEVQDEIDLIEAYNLDNRKNLDRWYDFLNFVFRVNRVIVTSRIMMTESSPLVFPMKKSKPGSCICCQSDLALEALS